MLLPIMMCPRRSVDNSVQCLLSLISAVFLPKLSRATATCLRCLVLTYTDFNISLHLMLHVNICTNWTVDLPWWAIPLLSFY